MASTRTIPKVNTLEVLLDEALEAYREMIALCQRLRRSTRDSTAYLDQLPEIAVCAEVITAKTEALIHEIDAIEDALPDNDE